MVWFIVFMLVLLYFFGRVYWYYVAYVLRSPDAATAAAERKLATLLIRRIVDAQRESFDHGHGRDDTDVLLDEDPNYHVMALIEHDLKARGLKVKWWRSGYSDRRFVTVRAR